MKEAVLVNEQPNDSQTEVVTQDRPRRQREPSVPEVAERIAVGLGVDENLTRARIHQIVWDFGRTQAQVLYAETLEHQDGQALAERFFQLVETRGVKKQRASKRQREAPSGEQGQSYELAEMIAEQLGEAEPGPRQMIARSIQVLGVEAVLALLQHTHDLEAAGGVPVPDGSRRRTIGGVYFYLVRQQVSHAQRKQIFPYHGPKTPPKTVSTGNSKPAVMTWADRGPALEEAEADKGEAKTMKLTITGRPGKIVERATCVVFLMQQTPKIPSLPAGLPVPPLDQVGATRYSVYIAAKQWKKVAEAIKDESDALIIE